MIDIMKIRKLVKDGKLETYVSKGKIYMRDKIMKLKSKYT